MEPLILARITHGSHLFGLQTEKSDMDFVSIVLPTVDQILLDNASFVSTSGSTSDKTRRNTSIDIDDKQLSLSMFLQLATSGTLDTVELLNAPIEFHVIEPHPIFLELQANKHRLASRNVEKIMGFCKAQGLTYSPRKERYEAAHAVMSSFLDQGITETSKESAGDYFAKAISAANSPDVFIKPIRMVGGPEIDHLSICSRMIPATVRASEALKTANGVVKKYGNRIRETSSASSHDWKALSHALRTAYEGIEYMSTGELTLPLPDRMHLLDIKLGRLPLEQVTDEVEDAVINLGNAARASTLPEKPDLDFVTEFIIEAHGNRVIADFDELMESHTKTAGLKLSHAQAMLGNHPSVNK